MKLEKREITLNETDSLRETFYLLKILSKEYIETLCKSVRKETKDLLISLSKDLLISLSKEVEEDLVWSLALMNDKAFENEN